jgi:AhpD family alkylhydroperoxidase
MATTTVQDQATEVQNQAKQAFGFVPNLITEMTEHNPGVGAAYLAVNGAIEEHGVLTPAEQQAVILAVSSFNDCHYCTKAHAAAGQQAGLSAETVTTINAGGLPDDERLRTLVQATRKVLGKRGWLSDTDLSDLEVQGVDRDALYEIVTLIGAKTISNYINHIAGTEVDEPFK